MAPDLNSVPPSPRSRFGSAHASMASSRRVSQSLGGAVAAVDAVHPSAPVDNTGVGTGPGPLRHPRPLTAADLYAQLETEQEAVVNRLTRELSLLRQQSASVVSSTSSTSAGHADLSDPHANHPLFGASHPTPSRRHRSSSNLSSRSAALGGLIGGNAAIPPRESFGRPDPVPFSRRSGAPSPSLSSPLTHGDHFPHAIPYPQPGTAHHVNAPIAPHPRPAEAHNPSGTAGSRYDEAAFHRAEFEAAKRENVLLRQRVQDLERRLGASRGRSLTGQKDPVDSSS